MPINIKLSNNLIFFAIFIVCLFFSIAYSIVQHSIGPSLTTGNFIEIPNGKSQITFNNSQFSFLIYVGTYLLKFGLSIKVISQILLFFAILSFFTGIYLIVNSIIKHINNYNKKLISFIFTFVTIFIIKLNFGSVDYPVMIFSEHTFGVYSLALPTLIFGLLANGNIFFAFFSAFLLLSIHGVIGAWILGILILNSLIYIFYYKKYHFIKDAILGGTLGLILFTLLLVFHIHSKGQFDVFGIVGYNLTDLNNWDLFWEPHRTNKEIDYFYLSKSILLMFILIIFVKFNKKYLDKNTSFALSSIILSIFLGSILYIFYKIFLEFLPPYIKAPIPTRVFNTHSFVAWPIIFSISIIAIKELSNRIKIKFNRALFIFFISIFIILITYNQKYLTNYIFAHYNKDIGFKSVLDNNPFRTRFANFLWDSPFKKNFFNEEKINEINLKRYPNINFWKKINKFKTNGYWLASSPHHLKLLRYGRKPILINSNSFDFVYYNSNSLDFVKDIIENIYNLPFDKPPVPPLKTYYGRVPNNLVKIEFENKNYMNWLKISNKYNLNYIIVPSNWEINLPIELSNGNLTLYKIQ
tara:strand:+ start:742 stop:2484 length:1743 start_codon:yes stop_codon:yes gene_type:complete